MGCMSAHVGCYFPFFCVLEEGTVDDCRVLALWFDCGSFGGTLLLAPRRVTSASVAFGGFLVQLAMLVPNAEENQLSMQLYCRRYRD
jgi:hypothetical protein